MICEYFVANISNFFVMLDWPASIILGNFWSPGSSNGIHNCGLWLWAQEKSPRMSIGYCRIVNWMNKF